MGAGGSGTVVVTGAQVTTSVINCYISPSNTGPWVLIADGFDSTSPFCDANDVGADLWVTMIGAPANWFFLVTMVTVG